MLEAQDYFYVCAAPAVYRLIGVSYGVNRAVLSDQVAIEQQVLRVVHVLILVDEKPTYTLLLFAHEFGSVLHEH